MNVSNDGTKPKKRKKEKKKKRKKEKKKKKTLGRTILILIRLWCQLLQQSLHSNKHVPETLIFEIKGRISATATKALHTYCLHFLNKLVKKC